MSRPSTASAAGLASILPDHPAGSLTLAAAVAASAHPLHPDALLLQLVADYFAAQDCQRQHDRDFDEAMKRYVAPPVPPALLYDGRTDGWLIAGNVKLLDSIEIDGVRRRHYSSEKDVPELRVSLAKWRQGGVSGHLCRRGDAILAALDAYVPAVKQAQDAAGITPARDGGDRENDRMDALLRRIAATPATTPDGLQAKARAAADDMADSGATWLADEHIPELLASKAQAMSVHCSRSLAVVFSVIVDAARLGGAASPVATEAAAA